MTIVPFERWRGELVMRTAAEHLRAALCRLDLAFLGRPAIVDTRTGLHLCTVVAVPEPDLHRWRTDRGGRWTARLVGAKWIHSYFVPGQHGRPAGGMRWASALSRARYENSHRGHRSGDGIHLLRIESSTAQNMVGRYLWRTIDRGGC